MGAILVFAEQRDGRLKKVAPEVVSEGRRLAEATGRTLAAVVVGEKVAPLGAELESFGPDLVLTASHPDLARYAPMAFTRLLAAAAAACSADVVLAPATALGRDVAARLAARLGAAFASDCVAVRAGADGALKAVRPVYSGKALATASLGKGAPAVLTLRPNVFAAGPAKPLSGSCQVREIAPSPAPGDGAVKAIELRMPETVEQDVAEADIVVSGGRAMQGPENFSHIRALAEALGGAVGASRAAVDAGWIEHRYQVGQTGKVVSPKLYIACGISGAIQHLAGMSSSKVIVAINKDGDAPIFKIADYGLVGDLYAVVPALVAEIRRLKEGEA
jgi:electron transfer flavoprotein alpha subunit